MSSRHPLIHANSAKLPCLQCETRQCCNAFPCHCRTNFERPVPSNGFLAAYALSEFAISCVGQLVVAYGLEAVEWRREARTLKAFLVLVDCDQTTHEKRSLWAHCILSTIAFRNSVGCSWVSGDREQRDRDPREAPEKSSGLVT